MSCVANSKPNPINEYYIAYFDILGYKEFFETQPEKVADFLQMIHDVIQRTNGHIRIANQSVIASVYGNINVKIRVFSDNFLLCLETSDNTNEPIRILAFLKIIADIQRGFVTEYGLFVRGGVTKGNLSFNDDYVFGSGLIEAVSMEEKTALYPRIIVNPALLETIVDNHYYSQEEVERAIEIETRTQNGEEIAEDEKSFYSDTYFKVRMYQMIFRFAQMLLIPWPDGLLFISYLHQMNALDMLGNEQVEAFANILKQISPSDFAQFFQSTVYSKDALKERANTDIDNILKRHKSIIGEKLKRYGSNNDIAINNMKEAELREKILRKYIWAMAYHNYLCDLYTKPERKISTECNCDARFLKMTIRVLDDEG